MKNSRKSIQSRWCVAAAALLGLMLALPALALPGDPIGPDVPLPVPKFGVSVAVDCRGNVYYTGCNQCTSADPPATLFKMDKMGVLISQTPIVNNGNQPVGIDEMSWDEGRQMLWGLEHAQGNPMKVWLIDPVTGLATFQFVANQSNSAGIFRDGIALDSTDDTLYLSGDVSTTVEQYMSNGTFIDQITPKADVAGNPLGDISGVVAGTGNVLLLGHNPLGGPTNIIQVQKTDGAFISGFAAGQNRVEGLECDTLNFTPLLALWVRDFGAFPNTPSDMNVFELAPGTCQCPGGVTGDDDDDNDDNDDDMPFVCSKPIGALSMIWNGQGVNAQPIDIVAHKGSITAVVIANINNIPVGGQATVTGMGGTPNDQVWEIYKAGLPHTAANKLGNSDFHISCSDNDMDGAEDCGKAEGDGKGLSGFINQWIFKGMVDSDQILTCP